MDVTSIDHVNLRIPVDGEDRAVRFYHDQLGFAIEGMVEYERGKKSFFDVRLAPDHVIHLWPDEDFAEPTGENYDHVALVVNASIADVKDELDAAGVAVDTELDAPRGATGESPSVYVVDPFGYRIELTQSQDA